MDYEDVDLGKPSDGADLKLGLATAPVLFAWEENKEMGELIQRRFKEEGDELEESGKDEAPEWSQLSKAENEKRGHVKESGGPYENGDDGRHEKS